jgi:RNA polymerase sigma-70 factor (ECF subfamily)
MTSTHGTVSTEAASTPKAAFTSTHWSVIVTAGDAQAPAARDALERLCRTYWFPLYAYVRRSGYSHEEAQDLTQAFFAHLLQGNRIGRADPQKGRFRCFLLAALKHFLADHWDRVKARKRGGATCFVPWDPRLAESRYLSEPQEPLTPEEIYEHNWAKALLEVVFERLRQEYTAEGKEELFGRLKGCLTEARAAVPYAELSRVLEVSEAGVRMAVHRLRLRYRDVLRMELAQCVADAGEVEEELRYLYRVLAG